MVEKSIIEIVKRYLSNLADEGIHARQAVLFGSYARGEAKPESDLDLIVIAPELDGIQTIETIKKLLRVASEADNRIEPIPCGELEWNSETGRPILEIAKKEGLAIRN
jgi:predicted nucleotidyltransferase